MRLYDIWIKALKKANNLWLCVFFHLDAKEKLTTTGTSQLISWTFMEFYGILWYFYFILWHETSSIWSSSVRFLPKFDTNKLIKADYSILFRLKLFCLFTIRRNFDLMNFCKTILNCFVLNALCSKAKQLRSVSGKFLRHIFLQIFRL